MNSQSYVYIRSQPGLYTVGFYDPSGKWHSESDHDTDTEAGERVHYLHGGDIARKFDLVAHTAPVVEELRTKLLEYAKKWAKHSEEQAEMYGNEGHPSWTAYWQDESTAVARVIAQTEGKP